MWLTVVAASGVIFAAVYMLWMFQRVMFGKVTNEENLRLTDMNGREIAYMFRSSCSSCGSGSTRSRSSVGWTPR